MDMTHHASRSIELRIDYNCINSEMYNKLKYIDCMGECYNATYVSIIMIICEH